MSPPPQARSTSTARGESAGGMCPAREAASQWSAANSPCGSHQWSARSSYWAGSLRGRLIARSWLPTHPLPEPEVPHVSVTVVGSLNEDVLVTVRRLPGRGETVIGRSAVLAPGGKGANQAAAAGLLGHGVQMVGRVGDDPAGERQLAALTAAGVSVEHVQRTAGVPTGSATIPVEEGSGENLIVVVPGANGEMTAADVEVDAVRQAGVVLLQLEVPLDTVLAAARAA